MVLRYLAGGRYELGEAAPVDPGRLLGLGLLFAGGTGAAGLLLERLREGRTEPRRTVLQPALHLRASTARHRD
jgi:hypothetical protein